MSGKIIKPNPLKFTIEVLNNKNTLFYENKPVKTREGTIICHSSLPLMKSIISELDMKLKPKMEGDRLSVEEMDMSNFFMLMLNLDFISTRTKTEIASFEEHTKKVDEGETPWLKISDQNGIKVADGSSENTFDEALSPYSTDPFLQTLSGIRGGQQIARYEEALAYFKKHNLNFPRLSKKIFDILKKKNIEFLQITKDLLDRDKRYSFDFLKVCAFFNNKANNLSRDRYVVADLLAQFQGGNYILSLMLVDKDISIITYARSLLASMRDMSDINQDIAQEKQDKRFSTVHELAQGAMNYIELVEESKFNQLVKSEESISIEFKSTLRKDLKKNRYLDSLTESCLKAIAAFLNTAGGTLVIGVGDDKEVLGIEVDDFKNNDKFHLYLVD